MNILVVDDEQAQLQLLISELEAVEPNSEIVSFLLPKEALAYVKENGQSVDVAFLDISMPQMDGLALAKEFKKINPMINIIFQTAFGEYSFDAMQMHASGYILKPVTRKQLELELDNLRYPIDTKKSGITVTTFGNFDIYKNGQSIHFARSKAKEVLAFLVDRRGAGVTKKELAAVIFEDREYTRTTQDYINKVVRELDKALREAGASEILIKKINYYAVDTTKFSCDMYDYIKGLPEALNAFRGEYMMQYSWAEDSIGEFL